MARRGQTAQPHHAQLSPDEMRAAIPRLQSRIADLRAVKVDAITDRYDPALTTLRGKVETTLADILGATFSMRFGCPTS